MPTSPKQQRTEWLWPKQLCRIRHRTRRGKNAMRSTAPTELTPPPAVISGLSSAVVRERLARFGPNDPTPVRRGALALEVLALFLNPLVVILLVASLVS